MSFFAQRRSAVLLSGFAVLMALTFCNGESGGGSSVAWAKKNTGNFMDPRDGKTYKSIKMPDGKTWMGENLNYETSAENMNCETSRGSWCYDDADSNCNKYGRLYDWNTAKTACPSGWHLPSRTEWVDLAKAAGGTGTYGDGGTAGTKLKSKIGWKSYLDSEVPLDEVPVATDEYGFSALPGGLRYYCGGNFDFAGASGYWWTATKYDINYAYYRSMHYEYIYMNGNYFEKKLGFSVRCIGD